LTFIVTDEGRPFTAAGFGNWFRKMCKTAGLPKHCASHGLRKASLRRLAEAGCTAHEIMSISGHKTLREVTRYTEAADRRQLARDAMAKAEKRTFVGKPG
jgi:integrase